MPQHPPTTPRNGPAARAAALLIAGVALVLLAACGGGGGHPQAQPAPDVTVFRGGSFDQLPRYPRSDELNKAGETNGVVTQSFSVSNTTPEQVLTFYHDHLVGWSAVSPVEATGADSYRGTWVKGDKELRVTAAKAPTLSQREPVVQYSLELGPPRSPSGSTA